LRHEVAVLPEQPGECADDLETGALVERTRSAVTDQAHLLQVAAAAHLDRLLDETQTDAVTAEFRFDIPLLVNRVMVAVDWATTEVKKIFWFLDSSDFEWPFIATRMMSKNRDDLPK